MTMLKYALRKGVIGWGLPLAAGLIVGHFWRVGAVTFDVRGFAIPVLVRLFLGLGFGLITGVMLWAWKGRAAAQRH